ncbi:hypothetical protein [uncultured Gammaproteobacteria bacterium]|jgi:hypothetical protein|nr:hypothetical protein BROOK1789B_2220 [Bathymodiolus brooksi thiotrophic gill symbiont]CAC9555768.1 hypothetical protein [uncultured Gammaproteobacteria bacterium]CAB9544309.1 hypothetical protein BROOK1789C_1584 [Bathymodiolus brooksi thiotrophic gill symbiont]CAC9556072.1 hypothetical protein [uncultured Gammaproteobacteria bacterium]CAC9560711.1 hypothetical protein [uncultured Gammaproteobacteria bacterium]
MIKDILNLLIFKPESIEYYQKYSLKTSIGAAIFISVLYGFLLPYPIEISFIANFSMMLMMVPVMLIITWFLSKLLKLKHKNTSFQALFALSILAGIIDLMLIPLTFLAQFYEFFNYLQLAIFLYSLLIFFFAFAKANGVGLGFSLLSMLLGAIVLIILMTTIGIAFIAIGLMPEPLV